MASQLSINIGFIGYREHIISDSDSSRYLLYTDLFVTSNLRCEYYYGIGSIISSILCTAADKKKAICNVKII